MKSKNAKRKLTEISLRGYMNGGKFEFASIEERNHIACASSLKPEMMERVHSVALESAGEILSMPEYVGTIERLLRGIIHERIHEDSKFSDLRGMVLDFDDALRDLPGFSHESNPVCENVMRSVLIHEMGETAAEYAMRSIHDGIEEEEGIFR